MKLTAQYLLFAGDDYYPQGGALDLVGAFDSMEAAIAAHDPAKFSYDGGWANILCLDEMRILHFFDRGIWSEKNA